LGYHGKLIKLAGGIFHTHHYVADGRQEILAAIAAAEGLSTIHTQQLLQAETTEAGLTFLRQLDACHQTTWVAQIYQQLVERIDRRTTAYAHAHSDCTLTVGSLLFDRKRTILATSDRAQALMQTLLVS
jgi:cobalt-precorrin-5B (C1)-methyltransferase